MYTLKTQKEWKICEVSILGLEQSYIIGTFADDTHFILEADNENLQKTKTLLDNFSWHVGCKFSGNTEACQWAWKESNKLGILLGFLFFARIDPVVSFGGMLECVRKQIGKWSAFHLSLQGRVLAANHLISSALWYDLILFAHDSAKMQKIQAIIISFIWGRSLARARPRVQASLIALHKLKDRLGIIAIETQAKALCFKLFLWSFQCGNHPLQRLIRKQV